MTQTITEHISSGAGSREPWVVRHSNWIVLAILAAAFAIRLYYCEACYLNPDEAAHFAAARPHSWGETLRAAFSMAHPPLFILVLHGTLFVGRSELILRLPSLLAGTAALLLVYEWIRCALGAIPALSGLGFMTLSPAAISASSEVRQYGLLLFFVAGSLYAAERALMEQSSIWTIAQGVFLLGAALSHYTAAIVLPCLGLYVLMRLALGGMPRRLFLTFGTSYVLVGGVLAGLFFWHVRGFIPYGHGASMDYLQPYYYSRVQETPFAFVRRAFCATFLHLAGPRGVTLLLVFLFVAGCGVLLFGRTKAQALMAFLVISPFAVGFAAGVLQIFPFAGSRHQTYLLPFFAAGISAAFSAVRSSQAQLLLFASTALSPLWLVRIVPDNNPRVMQKHEMNAAIDYIYRTVPRSTPLFTDYETRQVLRYYLGRNDRSLDAWRKGSGNEESLEGYRVIVPESYVWSFRSDRFRGQVNQMARSLNVPTDQPLWVISVAWLESSLASRLNAEDAQDVHQFGRISILKAARWRQESIIINWSDAHQVIDGFGAATAGVNPELNSAVMDFFYSDNGIHLKFIRVEIWPDQTECEASLEPGECVPSSAATISKVDLANAQSAVARGALVWATEWSPPGEMKSNHNVLSGGSFFGGKKNFSKLASIQTSFVRLLTGTYGITLYALSPQNEPDMSVSYPSCTWTAQQFHDYVPYLSAALTDAGYGSVKIMIAEESKWGNQYSSRAMADPAVASKIGILAAHGYGDCCSGLSWSNLTTQHIWETEVSETKGKYDGSMSNALAYARQIYSALAEANASSWHYWSISGLSFTDNEGLTAANGKPAKRAYALGNYSKFILPGWSRVGVTNSGALLVSAYKGPEAGSAVVVVNNGPTINNQVFRVGTSMGDTVVPWLTTDAANLEAQHPVPVTTRSFSYTVPANSVLTFVSGIRSLK